MARVPVSLNRMRRQELDAGQEPLPGVNVGILRPGEFAAFSSRQGRPVTELTTNVPRERLQGSLRRLPAPDQPEVAQTTRRLPRVPIQQQLPRLPATSLEERVRQDQVRAGLRPGETTEERVQSLIAQRSRTRDTKRLRDLDRQISAAQQELQREERGEARAAGAAAQERSLQGELTKAFLETEGQIRRGETAARERGAASLTEGLRRSAESDADRASRERIANSRIASKFNLARQRGQLVNTPEARARLDGEIRQDIEAAQAQGDMKLANALRVQTVKIYSDLLADASAGEISITDTGDVMERIQGLITELSSPAALAETTETAVATPEGDIGVEVQNTQTDLNNDGTVSPQEQEFNQITLLLRNIPEGMTPAQEERLRQKQTFLRKQITG